MINWWYVDERWYGLVNQIIFCAKKNDWHPRRGFVAQWFRHLATSGRGGGVGGNQLGFVLAAESNTLPAFFRFLAITLQLLLCGEVLSYVFEDWEKSNGPVATSIIPEFKVESKVFIGSASKTVSWMDRSLKGFTVSSVSSSNGAYPLP